MKVKDLIDKLNELGYNEDTTISFGSYNYDGEFYNFEIDEIEDGDRESGYDDIGVIFNDCEEYKRDLIRTATEELTDELRDIIGKLERKTLF